MSTKLQSFLNFRDTQREERLIRLAMELLTVHNTLLNNPRNWKKKR
jgi:hypothetical protein